MATTDTDVSQLVINKLTKAQYDGITTPSDTELYFVDDGKTYATTDMLPTVNDATLTVTQNGTSKGTFTANQSTNATIALTDTTYSAGTGINIDANNVISATASPGSSGEVYTIAVTGGQQIGTYASMEWAISSPFEIIGYLSYLNTPNPEFSITKSDGTTATVASMVSDTDALAAAQYKFDIEGPQGESSSIIAHPASVLESSNGFIVISGVYSLDETFYTGEADSLSIPPLRWKLVLNTDPNIPNASFVVEFIAENN